MRKGFWWSNVCNFLNKFLGIYRTKLKMLIVGDDIISDLFILADKTVALFRRVFIDGNFSSFFIRYYLKEKDQNRGGIFTRYSFLYMLKNLLGTTLIFLITSPFFIKLFKQSEKNEIILLKMIIALSPLIIGFFLLSFFTSLLNSNNRFEISNLAPLIGNSIYVLLLYLSAYSWISISPMWVFILGALIYTFVQVIFMVFYSLSYFKKEEDLDQDLDRDFNQDSNLVEYKNLDFQQDVKKGIGINILMPLSDVFVGILATLQKIGMFSYIEYGHRIIYAIFSIIAIPISTSILPFLAKLSLKDEDRFREESTKAFMITHVLAVPCIFLMFFFLEEVMTFFLKNISRIKDKEMLSKSVLIISWSLYFMMQNRILNSINNAFGKINSTLIGSAVYGGSTMIFTLILPRFNSYGIIWVGNAACLCQFFYLLYVSYRNKLFNFRDIHYFDFGNSFLISFFLILTLKKFFYYFSFQGFSIFYYFGMFLVVFAIYGWVFWNYIKFLFKKMD